MDKLFEMTGNLAAVSAVNDKESSVTAMTTGVAAAAVAVSVVA